MPIFAYRKAGIRDVQIAKPMITINPEKRVEEHANKVAVLFFRNTEPI